jgi:hypothetical protein
MTAAAHGVTSKSVCLRGVSRKAVSAQCMATPPVPHAGQATVASAMPATPAAKPTAAPAVKCTAPAVKSTAPTASAMPASAATPMPAGDCRGVRNDAKRANRNACHQNAYRSRRHGTLPTELLSLRRAHRDSALHQLSTVGLRGWVWGHGAKSKTQLH